MRLVFDNSLLSQFARAGQWSPSKRSQMTTTASWSQLLSTSWTPGCTRIRSSRCPVAAWLTPVRVEGLRNSPYSQSTRGCSEPVSDTSGRRRALAWAETHDATAVVDERPGTLHGRERGVDVHGTLWLIAKACESALLARHEVVRLVDALGDAEAWFPEAARGEGFFTWAAAHGLLSPSEPSDDGDRKRATVAPQSTPVQGGYRPPESGSA